MRIELNELIVDSEVDIRTAHDTDAISRYAESVGSLPPVTVFDTPEGLLLAGGFHRVAAAHLAGEFEIEADVRQGSRDEAMVFAALDNATHGVPLTKGERNTAIRRLKRLGWKQDDIAAGFGLSKSRVSHILRDELRNATPDGYGERVEEARLLVRSLEETRRDLRRDRRRSLGPGERSHPGCR